MEEKRVIAKKDERPVFESLIVAPTEAEVAAASEMPHIDLDLHQVQYLQTISEGWAFPLKGFMNEMELVEAMNNKTVTDANGKRHLLSVPITQHVSAEQKAALEGKPAVALRCSAIAGDKVLAVMHKPTFFDNRKEEICTRTFGTFSAKHPKAETICAQGDFLISAQRTHFFQRITFNDGMDKYRFTPREIVEQIKARNADAVYGFQVRNPLHNGHVLLLKDTREQLIK